VVPRQFTGDSRCRSGADGVPSPVISSDPYDRTHH